MLSFDSWRSFREAFHTVKSRNAMQPVLWLCLLVTVPSFAFASRSDGWLRICFFVVGCVPILQFLISYNFYMLKDPNRLSSEEYQLKNRAFDLIESKGGKIAISPVDIPNITNPYPESKKIAGPGEGGRK